MTTTVAALADRVLRRLGVVIVPAGDRPPSTATVTIPSIAAQALQNLGVIVPASDRPGSATVTTVPAIAASALQRLGVIIPASGRTPVTSITPLADLAVRALEMLAVIAPDETALPDDLATATAAIRALNDSMLSRGLVPWQADAIPEPASEEYTQLGAVYLAPSFGKTGDVAQRPVIEARIARIALVVGAQTIAEAKVNELNASLISRGIVDWTTIPSSAAEEYIQMTASELAPVFGQEPADPALRPAYEARIGRISLVTRAQAIAEDQVAQIQASMVARGTVSWADIPASAADQYIGMTEHALAPMFGKESDPKEYLALEARVRQISVIARAPEDAHDAVMAVHTDLTARGLARWSVFDLPDYVSDPYVVLAANKLAPSFDQQANPRDQIAAERALLRYVALPTSGEVTRAEYF